MPELNHTPHPAIVSRQGSSAAGQGQYLLLIETGAPRWTDDPEHATAFESMREAMRAAIRLPSGLRAYAAPLQAERLMRQDLH